MQKVYQKIIDPKIGDCFKCCVASLLELDYDDVPNFIESRSWFSDAVKFLKEKEYELSYKWLFNPNFRYLENAKECCFEDGEIQIDKDSSILAAKTMEGVNGLFIATVYSSGFTSYDAPFTALHSVICDRGLKIPILDMMESFAILIQNSLAITVSET